MEITTEKAIELAKSNWWEGLDSKTVAQFQFKVEKACMPFDLFHKAVEEALGRPVWTHEFGLNWDGLIKELNGESPSPTFEEIIDMIPEEKRILIVTT